MFFVSKVRSQECGGFVCTNRRAQKALAFYKPREELGELPMKRLLIASVFAFTAAITTSAFSADLGKPRVLVIDKKEAKVWGVPASRHFTSNQLFPNFWQRCPTGLVRADDVTDPRILATLKKKNPAVDYWYHFVCLDTEPTNVSASPPVQRRRGQTQPQRPYTIEVKI